MWQDARQQNVHFSARVVALNSRIGALTKQLKEAAQREQGLQAQVLPLSRYTRWQAAALAVRGWHGGICIVAGHRLRCLGQACVLMPKGWS